MSCRPVNRVTKPQRRPTNSNRAATRLSDCLLQQWSLEKIVVRLPAGGAGASIVHSLIGGDVAAVAHSLMRGVLIFARDGSPTQHVVSLSFPATMVAVYGVARSRACMCLFPARAFLVSFRKAGSPVPSRPHTRISRAHVGNFHCQSLVPRAHSPDPCRPGSPSLHPSTLFLVSASCASLPLCPHSPVWLPILALQRPRVVVFASCTAPARLGAHAQAPRSPSPKKLSQMQQS